MNALARSLAARVTAVASSARPAPTHLGIGARVGLPLGAPAAAEPAVEALVRIDAARIRLVSGAGEPGSPAAGRHAPRERGPAGRLAGGRCRWRRAADPQRGIRRDARPGGGWRSERHPEPRAPRRRARRRAAPRPRAGRRRPRPGGIAVCGGGGRAARSGRAERARDHAAGHAARPARRAPGRGRERGRWRTARVPGQHPARAHARSRQLGARPAQHGGPAVRRGRLGELRGGSPAHHDAPDARRHAARGRDLPHPQRGERNAHPLRPAVARAARAAPCARARPRCATRSCR